MWLMEVGHVAMRVIFEVTSDLHAKERSHSSASIWLYSSVMQRESVIFPESR